MWKVFLEIFKRPLNSITMLVLATIMFLFLRFLPNWALFSAFAKQFGVFSSYTTRIFFAYLKGIFTSVSVFESILLILLSLCIAMNIVVFVVFVRRQQKLLEAGNSTLSFTGMFLGLFGAGCASCGTLLLAPLLSVLGFAGFLQQLPLHGGELGILGVILVIISTTVMLRKLAQPVVCEI